jgi:predicted amino acid dehydrogenase
LNPGQNYTSTPNVAISGDGTGATATATIVNGKVQKITINNRGIDYTRATITISGGNGYGATAEAIIDARTGALRTVYYDINSQRQIVDESAGEVDYELGVVTLKDINIKSVSATDGYVRISVESEKGIISSNKNTIVTLDEYDPVAISTTLETV